MQQRLANMTIREKVGQMTQIGVSKRPFPF